MKNQKLRFHLLRFSQWLVIVLAFVVCYIIAQSIINIAYGHVHGLKERIGCDLIIPKSEMNPPELALYEEEKFVYANGFVYHFYRAKGSKEVYAMTVTFNGSVRLSWQEGIKIFTTTNYLDVICVRPQIREFSLTEIERRLKLPPKNKPLPFMPRLRESI